MKKRIVFCISVAFASVYSSSSIDPLLEFNEVPAGIRAIIEKRKARPSSAIGKSPLRIRRSSSTDSAFLDKRETGSIAELVVSRSISKEEEGNLKAGDE